MNDAQWKSIIENAKRNTLIYRRVFGCIPDDTVTIIGEITRLASDAKLLDFFKLKDQIIGHAVEYPLSFLKDEDLSFKPNQK
jgi:phospholipase D1/2